MADLKYINNAFTQCGDICALASYGAVIEYFSQRKLQIEQVLSNYFEKNKLYNNSGEAFYFSEKHRLIYEHFHDSCRQKGIKGFEYIKQLHDNNFLDTKDYCEVLDIKASPELVVDNDLFLICETLKNKDALVMILYKAGEEIRENVLVVLYHAITIGYYNNQEEYFYKDPLISGYVVGDIIFEKPIYEYIVFAKKNMKLKII